MEPMTMGADGHFPYKEVPPPQCHAGSQTVLNAKPPYKGDKKDNPPEAVQFSCPLCDQCTVFIEKRFYDDEATFGASKSILYRVVGSNRLWHPHTQLFPIGKEQQAKAHYLRRHFEKAHPNDPIPYCCQRVNKAHGQKCKSVHEKRVAANYYSVAKRCDVKERLNKGIASAEDKLYRQRELDQHEKKKLSRLITREKKLRDELTAIHRDISRSRKKCAMIDISRKMRKEAGRKRKIPL